MKIGFNFLTIMEDWKSPDVSAAGMISRNNQKCPSLSQVNETENLKELFDTSKTPIIKLELEAEKEIKERPKDEVFMERKCVKCEICLKVFTHNGALFNHKKRHKVNSSKCEYCLKVFPNTIKLHSHIWKVHQFATKHDCLFCKKSYQSFDDLKEHMKNCDESTRFLLDI